MNTKLIPPILFIFASLILTSILVYTSHGREFSNLENMMIQIFFSLAGIGGSYLLGKTMSEDMAQESIKLHAKPAFRRVVSHYESLSRMARHLESNTTSTKQTLELFKYVLYEQIQTVDHSIEDWKDIVPDEVERVLENYKNTNRENNV